MPAGHITDAHARLWDALEAGGTDADGLQVVTDEGKIYQGYERRTRESQQTGNLVIQELSSGKLVTIARDQVEEKIAAGSAMPAGLTAILSPEQLQDLVRYLVDLGKIK